MVSFASVFCSQIMLDHGACWGFPECILSIEVGQFGLEVVDVFRSFPSGKPILVDKLEAARKPKAR